MTAQSTPRSTAAPRAASMPLVSADGLKAAGTVQRHAFVRLERLCEESFRFATARLEENRQMLSELAQAPSPQEQMAIWGRHVERTMKQYSDNFGTIAGICSEQALEAVQEGAAQMPVAEVAEVMPSPIADVEPPVPAAEPETAVQAAADDAADDAAGRASAAKAMEIPADAQKH